MSEQAREMTTQERAAAIAEQIVRALDVHPSPINIDAVLPWVKETRRAALEEASKVVKARTITDVEGDWDRGHNMAVQNIAAALDRLREGVGK